MKANPSSDTVPEVRLRSLLHHAGLRYRVNHSVHIDQSRPVLIDIAFTRYRLAVFVDGCFWHACPSHGTVPKANNSYWSPKLRGNFERDLRTNARLTAAGWHVLRFWEHEDPHFAADQVIRALQTLRPRKQAANRDPSRQESTP